MGSSSDPVQLLIEHGQADYIGEPVSQLEHALQCAALAERAHASDALVAAALFHDIGHMCAGADAPVMDGLGIVEHERVGAEFLAAAGYPEVVCELVRGHVEAKRYLVGTNLSYAQRLSPASRATLKLQGGAFNAQQAQRFQAHPLSRDKLRLRMWDEQAKDPHADVPGLSHYAALLERLRRETRTGIAREARLP